MDAIPLPFFHSSDVTNLQLNEWTTEGPSPPPELPGGSDITERVPAARRSQTEEGPLSAAERKPCWDQTMLTAAAQ